MDIKSIVQDKMILKAVKPETKEDWLLVHDGKFIIKLDNDVGNTTHTAFEVFTGTEKECQDEIKRLGLVYSVIE